MNINEVRNSYLGVEKHKEIGILCDLVDKNGSCSMNGYLGSSNVAVSFDDEGLLEFYTESKNDDLLTKSRGVVLDGCVLIKQIQDKEDTTKYNQLISWDVSDNSYTYISFDNVKAMDSCYEKIKAGRINLAKEDISLKFSQLNISFDSIAQVLLNQKVDVISSMIDESTVQTIDDVSFIL